jgi:hypothetical protein
MYRLIFKKEKIVYTIGINESKSCCEDAEINGIRDQLNTTKKGLEVFVRMGIFDMLMRAYDVYMPLKNIVKKNYNGQIVTNAWLKMYELMIFSDKSFDMSSKKILTAFHNAELPGAFISAVNHYMATINPEVTYDWCASSYWPSDSNTALEDAYCMYENNKTRWLMSSESPIANGDMMHKSTILYIVEKVRKTFPYGVDLYTSDAGMELNGDYDNQEEITMKLNFGQIVCGLLCMADGGVFITKQYTFYCEFNRSLIIALSAMFDRFYIAKPRTSRPVNSEIYLVGHGFRGVDTSVLMDFVDLLPDDDSINLLHYTLVDMKDPDNVSINTELKKINKELYDDIQIPALQDAIEMMTKTPDAKAIRMARESISKPLLSRWLRDMRIGMLPQFAKFETCAR